MKILVLSAILLMSATVFADNAIVSFTNNAQESNDWYNVAGYEFTTTSTLDITALAVEACGSYCGHNTLVDSHFVGIYNAAGSSLLVGTTVAAGSATDAEGFSWVALPTDYVLAAGTYFIGVQYNQYSQDWKWTGNGTVKMGPDVTFDAVDGFFNINNHTLVDPNDPAGTANDHYVQNYSGPGGRDSYISANFAYTPEPGSLLLLGSGIAGLAGFSRRKLFAR